MKNIKWLAASTLLLAIFLTSCQKEEEPQLNTEEATQQMIVASEDNATAEDLFQTVEDEVDQVLETRGGGSANPDCPTITVDPSWDEFPRTVTIDFGTGGCVGPNGRVRRGVIVVEQTAAWFVEGAVRTANFIDFSIDDAQIFGTRTLVNEGYDVNGNVTFTRTVSDAKIIFPNGDETTWESNNTLTQTDGGNTPFVLLDNVYEITGNASGVNREGQAYTVDITSPLVKDKLCPWVSSGIVELQVDSYLISLDYGPGTCDKFAILTLPNGTEHQIVIQKWW